MRPPEVDRRAASERAVAARQARARVKRQVTAGIRSASEVLQTGLSNPDSAEGTLRARDLLRALPGVGPVRSDAILRQLGIATTKRVGGLGRLQRKTLAQYLDDRAARTARRRSRLVVLAGPTAVGKGTVSTYIREHYPHVLLSVSATTRAPRPGEVDGVSYFFVTDQEFDQMIERDEFLEWATVHNQHRYGTPRAPIQAALDAGRSVLLEIDIQGARQVRVADASAVLVFLLPPTWEELVRRLVGRGTETEQEQRRRLETAQIELAAQDEFDYRVVNASVPDAAAEVVELMSAS